ncbi:MAG: GGDEF domain-containing protein [Burkholderiales bacterium]|nr:GGDEF domain-containing protein [Burkholderiales bacterium]
MTTNSNTQLPKGSKGSVPLTKALAQNEHAKTLVADAARELSSVNEVLKQELAEKDPLPAVENAIEKSEGVEGKVQEVADKLAIVNRALEGEVRDRVMLDRQFAAVTEQGEAARYAAFHDPLTGLPNRALFSDRLEHALAQALRHGWNLALMFVDLDKFKKINDLHGHDAGDRVLQTIADRLKQITRADDTVSRHGGDEFLYLLMETPDEKVVSAIAEKILDAIQMPCEVSVGENSLRLCVSASIGISMFPKNGTTAEALINSADAAMYVAKRSKVRYGFAM